MARPTDHVVIGIDFGTTFSGFVHNDRVAVSYSAKPDAPDDIKVIKSWPGGNNVLHDKVPSEITYGVMPRLADERKVLEDDAGDSQHNKLNTITPTRKRKADDAFDLSVFKTPTSTRKANASGTKDNAQMRWGFEVRTDESRLSCLKLLLDPDQSLPEFVSLDSIKQQLATSEKNVSSAVADYLRALFDHTKEMLQRQYGELFVSTISFRVVLTVPAVWSDAAKDATLKAAKTAGMGENIITISEPEAAAVYALQSIQHNRLSVGQNFTVIDAGGGTVDLITYAIRQLTPLRLEEVARGTGECCGAVFLNTAFEKWVQKKIGNKAFHSLRLDHPKTWLTASQFFEDYVKRKFDPASDESWSIPLPGLDQNPAAGLEGGYLFMSASDVESIFEPILGKVISLVDRQIRSVQDLGETVSALILVGGFGQSACLAKCLHWQISKSSPSIGVLQPLNAWTAVVRGAVLRGLEGQELVLSRKARRHYGIAASQDFDERIHSADVKYWDHFQQCWKAKDQMQWYIKKGETVPSDEPILFSFYRCFSMAFNKHASNELIVCEDDDAPSQLNARTRTICVMQSDLTDVPAPKWHQKHGLNGPYKRLNYKLGMQIESGGLSFDLRVDDVTYGKVTTTFD
ncbi:hypothetical protein D0868_03980 [Hortaea werneckii]|uniref:Actin-like ATPase domain-containing protein n=2 Tax=Hortaea werneckii TaxID=91943 RepID=A0A3M6Z3N6_HORWE|nr:hypothetical protein D0868_03980 [Hortaea werneckii]